MHVTRRAWSLLLVVVLPSSFAALRGVACAWSLAGRYLPATWLLDSALFVGLAVAALLFIRVSRRGFAALARRSTSRLARTVEVLGLLLVFALLVPVAFAIGALHPARVSTAQDPGALGLAFEEVALRTDDGLKLAAWFVPPEGEPRATVLLAHGLGCNRQCVLGPAALLHRLGYGVLLLDFRGHGDSEGWLVTYGLRETRDLAAAREWLARRFPREPSFALGFSMGAATLLRSSCEGPLFDRLAVDSSFARLAPVAELQMRAFGPLALVGWQMVRLTAWAIVGSDPTVREPLDCVAQAARRPLLLIHGTADRLIPVTAAHELAEQAHGAQLWLVEGAEHVGAFGDPAYGPELERFFGD